MLFFSGLQPFGLIVLEILETPEFKWLAFDFNIIIWKLMKMNWDALEILDNSEKIEKYKNNKQINE